MKTLKLILAVAITALMSACCGTKNEEPKTLVLYYSLTGNTKMVAEEIAADLAADIEEITCVDPYDTNFMACIERCKKEREDGTVTEINPVKADLSKYDVIFIGYPVWFGTYAPPIATFLANNDLSGKTIVPFCTFGSGGLESSVKDMTTAQPNAKVLEGYGVRAARLEAMPKEVEQYLIANGFTEGEYTAPAEFPKQHPVSEEEAAIFNTAVDGYPMLNAEAISVASRTIANGTEYLFTARDLPRDRVLAESNKKSDLPPAGEMKIYVTVTSDKTEFTRVVR
ncbi:MAG: NAD(P)H-dependent oxidoreductase [Bacteroidales bacterium]|nr:NAD(P)H-dependent oxidoreductase [Bacteroidales bacterium]